MAAKRHPPLSFLHVIEPEYVLIPAGYRNQFGHPHQDVLLRYQQIKAKWLTSADSGAITISVKRRFMGRAADA